MPPTILIQHGTGGRDVDGLLNPSLKPSRLTVQHRDVIRREVMRVRGHVCRDRGRLPAVLCHSLLQAPFSFTYVDSLVAVIAVNMC